MKRARRAMGLLREAGPRTVLRRTGQFLRYRFFVLLRRLLPETGKNAFRDKFRDLRMLSGSSPTIVDGGAHRGETITQLQRVFDEPTIHAFEANPDLATELEAEYGDERVSIHNLALGPEQSEVTLNLTKGDQSSSVRESTAENERVFGDTVSVESTVTVQQDRLDKVLGGPPEIVKLDVQGYELQALRGSEAFLDEVELVLAETSVRELYEGQELFCDLHRYLTESGFELFNIYDTTTVETGELAEFDVLYWRGR